MAKKHNNKIKDAKSDVAFDILNHIFMVIVLFVSAYPLLIIVSSSFSDPYALMSGKVWLFPVKFTLEGYKAVLHHDAIWLGFYNSLLYMILGTVMSVAISVLMAYPLSRNDFTMKNPLSLLFAFTMWFSGGLIPTYIFVKNLGLYDTRWAMWLPGMLNVWNAIIVRTYFATNVGGEILESAKIDGCSDFRYLLSIAIPLAKPTIAVIALYYAVGYWNAYMTPLLYIKSESLQPIQIFLREILLQGQVDEISPSATAEVNAQVMNELLKYTVVVVASIPMIVIYPFVQKFFVKGIMVGSVKG